MNWELGTAYRETELGHLYFVVAKADEKRAVVSLATYSSAVNGDDSCILEAGEHPFVRHRTYVNYSKAENRTVSQLNAMLSKGEISVYNAPADTPLIIKILKNARKSDYIEYRVLSLMESQLIQLDCE